MSRPYGSKNKVRKVREPTRQIVMHLTANEIATIKRDGKPTMIATVRMMIASMAERQAREAACSDGPSLGGEAACSDPTKPEQ